MAKDIILFGSIGQYSVMYVYEQIGKALGEDPQSELALRVNTTGGDPDYGMSVIEKVQELEDQIIFKGGSQLHSYGLFLMAYIDIDKIEILDVTKGVLHRAAWPDWIESSPAFPGSMYEQLVLKANKDTEKAFRARIDVDALESLPQMKAQNITLKDIFSMEGRVEVLLTAQDMKKIGLVKNINKITPVKEAAMKTEMDKFSKCASLEEYRMAASAATPPTEDEPKNTNMTLEELKAKFPALYAQVMAEGHKEGVAAEKERVEAIMVFIDVDATACKTAIEAGKPLSAKQVNELALKSFSAEALKTLKKDSNGEVITEEVKEGAEADKVKKTASFEKELDKRLGLKVA
jgi:hypothetical protein